MSYFMNQKDGVIIYHLPKSDEYETPREQLFMQKSIQIQTFNESFKQIIGFETINEVSSGVFEIEENTLSEPIFKIRSQNIQNEGKADFS